MKTRWAVPIHRRKPPVDFVYYLSLVVMSSRQNQSWVSDQDVWLENHCLGINQASKYIYFSSVELIPNKRHDNSVIWLLVEFRFSIWKDLWLEEVPFPWTSMFWKKTKLWTLEHWALHGHVLFMFMELSVREHLSWCNIQVLQQRMKGCAFSLSSTNRFHCKLWLFYLSPTFDDWVCTLSWL